MNKEDVVVFTIFGEPQGKARPRVVRNRFTGNTVVYTTDKTKQYEAEVRNAFLRKAVSNTDGVKILTKPVFEISAVSVNITAYFGIPKSKSKKYRQMMLSGEIHPTKKPDCDNIAKIICDALNGYAYKDDAQIIKINVIKQYSDEAKVVVEISSWSDTK